MRISWPALAALLLLAATGRAQEPVATVEVELHGPVGEVRFDAGRSPTHVRLLLQEGESRRLRVPVEVLDTPGRLEVHADVGAECALVTGEPTAPGAWRLLPRALQARSLPTLEGELTRPRPGLPRLALLVAAALLVFAARRRPSRALALGLLAVAGVLLLPAPLSSRAEVVVLEGVVQEGGVLEGGVLEGDGASGKWLEVRAARDRLVIVPGAPFWARTLPRDEGYRLEVTQQDAGLRWAICAPGARVFAFRVPGFPPRLARGSNLLLEFDRVWLRQPGAGWSDHGAWPLSEPFPAEVSLGEQRLPGWLAASLPQGVTVFVGRARTPGRTTWVRLVGF